MADICATAVLHHIGVSQNTYDDIDEIEVEDEIANENLVDRQNNKLSVFLRRDFIFEHFRQ